MDYLATVIQANRQTNANAIEQAVLKGDTALAQVKMDAAASFESQLAQDSIQFELQLLRAHAETLRTNAAFGGAMNDGGASGYSSYADAYEAGFKRGRASLGA